MKDNKNIFLKTTDKIGLVSNLSTMLSAGISILETIDSLLEDSKGNQKKILETVRADIVQGKYLSASFSKFPQVFVKVTVNIIKAAEEAGTLDVTLRDLKENIKKESDFSNKVRTAFIYPAVIMVVFVGVLLVFLVFVIPKISTVFTRLRVELPLPTKVLIVVSNFFLAYTIPLIVSMVAGGLLLAFLYRRNRLFMVKVFSSLPVVSQLVKEIDLTRFTRSLSLLLSSGIPIITALDYTRDVVMKPGVVKAITQCHDMVLSGRRLSEGFRLSKTIFPSIMIKITEAGEKTGTLDRSMKEISEYLDYQVSHTLSTLLVLLEPVMLVAVGLLVGGMMLAIIAPIYGLIGQVGNR